MKEVTGRRWELEGRGEIGAGGHNETAGLCIESAGWGTVRKNEQGHDERYHIMMIKSGCGSGE